MAGYKLFARKLKLFVVAGIIGLCLLGVLASACTMPKDPDFIRVGDTRFFIHHHKDRSDRDKFSSYDEAKEICGKEAKMRMPKIDNMSTLVMVGRQLENYVAKNALRDTWYWLDAVFDDKKENYFWQDNQQEIQFATFHQRFPRPTGVGAHVDYNNVYDTDYNSKQCLSLTLPWPNDGNYGHSTSFGERACEAKAHKHAMCESTDPACNPQLDNPYRVTEKTSDYFYEGNWILGKRKFILNWKPRQKDEAVKYCESLGLQLYTPDATTDVCLIPFIKMWAREVTKSQWWSAWTYRVSDRSYTDAKGNKVKNTDMNTAFQMKFTERSSKKDPTFCVAVSHEYEFSNGQHPCWAYGSGKSGCNWHFVDFVPANCKNRHGTICQHADYAKRACEFRAGYTKNIHFALQDTATIPFGWETNEELHRSAYKQVFGSMLCPKMHRMLRANNSAVWMKPKEPNKVYKYDLMESYWVVDKDGFEKTESSLCTISVPSSEADPWTRKLEQVPCTSWHFYACERISMGIRRRRKKDGRRPELDWDDKEYKRIYPHAE